MTELATATLFILAVWKFFGSFSFNIAYNYFEAVSKIARKCQKFELKVF